MTSANCDHDAHLPGYAPILREVCRCQWPAKPFMQGHPVARGGAGHAQKHGASVVQGGSPCKRGGCRGEGISEGAGA